MATSREQWLATKFQDGPDLDIEDINSVDELLEAIDQQAQEKTDASPRGGLRKGKERRFEIRIDERTLAMLSKAVEFRLDSRYASKSHIARYGIEAVLKQIWEDNKENRLVKINMQDQAKRELEESALIMREHREFILTLRQDVMSSFDDPEDMEMLRQKAEAFYNSGISSKKKESLRSLFPNLGG